jgi:mRNA interferase RelE/StbE
MAWTIEFSELANKQIDKLDPVVARRILHFLQTRVLPADDPTSFATRLKGPENDGRWRYRVGDFRIIVSFDKNIVTIYVIEIGHRREIYR